MLVSQRKSDFWTNLPVHQSDKRAFENVHSANFILEYNSLLSEGDKLIKEYKPKSTTRFLVRIEAFSFARLQFSQVGPQIGTAPNAIAILTTCRDFNHHIIMFNRQIYIHYFIS